MGILPNLGGGYRPNTWQMILVTKMFQFAQKNIGIMAVLMEGCKIQEKDWPFVVAL